MTTNPYVENGRLRKATAIADVLQAHKYRADVVAGFVDAQWKLAAAAARVNQPHSDETKEMVVRLLRQREEAARMTVDEINEKLQGTR